MSFEVGRREFSDRRGRGQFKVVKVAEAYLTNYVIAKQRRVDINEGFGRNDSRKRDLNVFVFSLQFSL